MPVERLIPSHIMGGLSKQELQARKKGVSPKEMYRLHARRLLEASELEGILVAQLKERGIEPPENRNLSLLAVEEFQRYVYEAQDLRRVVQFASDSGEQALASALFVDRKAKVDEYLALGLPFEKAYREYIKARLEYIKFSSTLDQIMAHENALVQPSFASVPFLSQRAHARIETLMGEMDASGLSLQEGQRTKKDITNELGRLNQRVQELWEDPMVRYFWQKQDLERMLSDFASGADVIENQSIIRSLNTLHDWEKEHQRTTIGGVLVGPPGVGKTTLVRHYLHEKGRNYVYIDLSEDVTRYLLYGSKSIEFNSPAQLHEDLMQRLTALDEDSFRKLVLENTRLLKDTFGLREDEAVVTTLAQIDEAISAGRDFSAEENGQILVELQRRINNLAQQAFRAQLAQEFAQLVKRNGWRDGIIISALRRGDSIIFDEFTKNKNWSLIFGLMTAKPDEDWYFADNDEWIKIPEYWRMYFTGNIGRKHGGFVVAEALASRAGGKVVELGYPTPREEMQIALVALSNAEGDFLRSKDDLAKLYVLIYEVFPKVRSFIEDKAQAIPISYRTIRDLGEKLVLYRDPRTGIPVFQPTDKSLDEAVYEVLVESYGVYEDQTIPREIVNLATSVGLLFDERVKDRVLQWMAENVYNERKLAIEDHREDFEEIVKKIRGVTTQSFFTETNIPKQRRF